MSRRLPSPEAILRAQPFAPAVVLREALPLDGRSGTACLVVDQAGRRYKLRLCASRWRAREIEALVGALGEICPRPVARRGRLLLLEGLSDHRPLERDELLERLGDLGAMVAQVHASAGRLGLPGPVAALRGRVRARFQRARDLRLLAREGVLGDAEERALRRKLASHRRRFGSPVAVELDDLHKGNLMLRPADGDLRYVDEEGVAVRPLGTSLASLVKTADREAHWRAFRDGYARIREPGWITPAYTEYVVLLDTVRKVANKLRSRAQLDAERAGKLPDEIADLRRVVGRREPSLDWRFHRG